VGNDWVAVIDVDSTLLGLESHGIPTNRVTLTQVSDITPYAEGTRQLRDRNLNRWP
jgi:hypothetical protein